MYDLFKVIYDFFKELVIEAIFYVAPAVKTFLSSHYSYHHISLRNILPRLFPNLFLFASGFSLALFYHWLINLTPEESGFWWKDFFVSVALIVPVYCFIRSKSRACLRRSARAELHRKTMNKFYQRCREASRGVFFNVQIDMEQWFYPFAQVHLAVHSAAAQNKQLTMTSLNNSAFSNLSVEHRHNWLRPFRRVIFAPVKSDELHEDLKRKHRRYWNLIPFGRIHRLMACPLAIVPLEVLAQLIRDNAEVFAEDITNNDFDNDAVDKYKTQRADLGLKDINKTAFGIDTKTVRLLKRYNKKYRDKGMRSLKTKLKGMQKQASGKIDSSIDFAVLYFDDGHPEIWQAERDKWGKWVYFKLSPESLKEVAAKHQFQISWLTNRKSLANKENMTNLDNARLHVVTQRMKQFSYAVESLVFAPANKNEDIPKKQRLAPDPVTDLEGKVEFKETKSATVVKERYSAEHFCPQEESEDE